MRCVEDMRVGLTVRGLRRRQGLRQSDVAGLAGVAQSTVSRLERGHLDHLSMATLRSVFGALETTVELAPRWRGGEIDRLLDSEHAALVIEAATFVGGLGWLPVPEVSFSVYGERGSIDLLAWHPPTRTLLVIEIKTSLNSIEATLRRQDVKVRLAARIARERFGWDAMATGSMLVLPDTATSRRRVERHAGVLGHVFTVRGREARAWLRQPGGAPGLLLFLSDVRPRNLRSGIAPRRRVRRARSQPSAANGGRGRTSEGIDRQ